MADMTRKVVLQLLAQNKASADLARFGHSIDKVRVGIGRMAKGLLVAAGVGGFAYMIKQQMKVIDSTAKLSDRLGMTTEALVGLQHAANIAGVESGTLSKSLEIFSRRLGEVSMGTGEAARALEALGVDYNVLVNTSPDEAIKRVADEISKLKTQSEKAAVANYLFGRSGQQLLNLFEQGSRGIEKYRREAELLGLTFSRIDAAKVEAANDALTRTKAVFTGLFRSATIELAPYLETVADSFADWAMQGEGVGQKMVNVFDAVSHAGLETAKAIAGISLALDKITLSYSKFQPYLKWSLGPATSIPLSLIAPSRPDMKTLEAEIRREEKAWEDRKKQLDLAFERFRSGPAQQNGKLEKNLGRLFGIDVQEGPSAVEKTSEELKRQLTFTEELLQKMRHEIALDKMSGVEKAKTLAIEKLREQIQKDIAAGIERSADLTAAERAEVERLAAEQYKVAEAGRKATVDITAAYVRMYDSIDSRTASSYAARRKLIEQEFAEYEKLLGKTREIELAKQDALNQLAVQQAKGGDDALEGINAALYDLNKEIAGIGKLFYDLTVQGVGGFTDALTDAVFEAENLEDALRNVGLQMAKTGFRWGVQNATIAGMEAIFGGMSGGISGGGSGGGKGSEIEPGIFEGQEFHGGGIVGRTNVPVRAFPASMFASAPRLHDGLRSNEMGVILERGEEVISKDDVVASRRGNANLAANLAAKLDAIIRLLSQRQQINVNTKLVDSREVVTRQDMEGREGERLVMHHVGRNQ